MFAEVGERRVDQILSLLVKREGFANYVILADELRSILQELKRYRAKPAHCPGCDGEHL